MVDFLNDIAQIFSAQLSEKRLDLTLDLARNFPKTLVFDPVRVRQVFINLIANAVKFTKDGGVNVQVNYSDGAISVVIEDSGIGIPEEAQQRIFESFQQVDNSSTRAFGGTGLGLSIAREICIAMEGKIELLRSSSTGSAFKFVIKAPSPNSETLPCPKFDKTRILILAEAKPFGYWLQDSLNRCQLAASLFYKTEEAIAAVKEHDLIIVDSKIGAQSLVKIAENLPEEKQLVWISWVGEDIPAEINHPVRRFYKPMTAFDFPSLFVLPESNEETLSQATAEGKILLAEDNPINLKSIKSQLENAGFKVDSVSNGAKAVEASRKQKYDLILMDIQMPEMDGKEATRIINTEQGKHAPPIVGISAHVLQAHVESARSSGMVDYICKPISEETLIKVVSRILS